MSLARCLAAALLASSILEPHPFAHSLDVLRGTVVERETGRPIAGAKVCALPDERATFFALEELAVTDAKGAFELVPGGYSGTCVVRAPGRALGTFSTEGLASAPTLGLEPAGTFVLHVRTSDALRRELRVLLDVERSLLDVHGAHEPSLGRVTWNQGLEDFGATNVGATNAGAESRVASVRFDELPLGVPLQLRIHALGEERRPDDDLVLIDSARLVERNFVLTASVDVGGELRRAHGRGDTSARLLADHEVWLTPYVRDDGGRSLSTVEPVRTCTDSNGRFRFDHVPPGVWVVATPPVEHLLATAPDSLQLAAPTRSIVVNFGVGAPIFVILATERSGWLVAGRVVDSSGLPVADATVSTAEGPSDSAVTRGADGVFVLGPLELPRATDDVLAKLHVIAAPRNDAWTRSAPVAIDGPAQGLELRLRRAARLRGSVVDEHGEPVAHAAVTRAPFGPDSLARFSSATTGPDGHFELVGVEPGACTLVAHTVRFERMAAVGLDVAEGEARTELLLTLRPSASVILAPALLRTHRATVSIHVDGVCVAGPLSRSELVRGAKSPRRVPAGSVRVLRTRDDERSEVPQVELVAEFDLAPGETRTVEDR